MRKQSSEKQQIKRDKQLYKNNAWQPWAIQFDRPQRPSSSHYPPVECPTTLQ
jgi:hypothetical protein